jgi:putative PIN family toxin of toxin-antitoxin system
MKKSKHLRIIVDANGWFSFLLSPDFRFRLEGVFNKGHSVLCSEKLFYELGGYVRKPYLAKQIVRTEYEELVAMLRSDAELVDVRSVIDVCRDPKDNYLLALAKDGEADYLITGDSDLRVLKEFGKTKIMNLTEFESEP